MPCYSRVTKTQMTDAERLEEALRQTGHKGVTRAPNGLSVSTDSLMYTRRSASDPFTVADYTGQADLGAVGRTYAELSVRTWAQRSGFTVQESGERQMVLVNRRGG